MTSLSFDKHKGRSVSYDVRLSGLNYRIDEMRSALGLVQLSKLASGTENRKRLTNMYWENLKDIVDMPFIDLSYMDSCEPAYHIMPVLLPESVDRQKVHSYMKSFKIQTSIHYPFFGDFSSFSQYDFNKLDISRDICKRELTLPLYPTMTDQQVIQVSQALISAIDNS